VEDIQKKESELNSLIDADLRAELGKYRQFDILNTEKMTPRFLSITKSSKFNTDNLDSIVAADGSVFATATERDTGT
jgi:hypothetical protein